MKVCTQDNFPFSCTNRTGVFKKQQKNGTDSKKHNAAAEKISVLDFWSKL